MLVIWIKSPDLEPLQSAQHELAALIRQFHPVQDVRNGSNTVQLRSRLDLALLSFLIALVGFSHHEADDFFFTDLIPNPAADHTISPNHRQNTRENWTLINRKDWNTIGQISHRDDRSFRINKKNPIFFVGLVAVGGFFSSHFLGWLELVSQREQISEAFSL